jgi:catechol 2,3-dioxygenase-like lactoylglutathione lyase family enzyme
MLGPILAVTLLTKSLVAVEHAYVDQLGYELIERGEVDASLAKLWDAPKAQGRKTILVAPRRSSSGKAGPEKDGRVLLRFVEAPDLPHAVPHATTGWNVVEFNVGKVDELAKRLEASLFRRIAGPAPLPFNPAIRAMQLRDPDGGLVYMTQVDDAPSTQHLPRTMDGVGSVFIMVMGVTTTEEAVSFFRDGLGVELTKPFEFKSKLLSWPLGLSDDHAFHLSLARLPEKFTVEIDELGPTAGPRVQRAGDLPSGIVSVSFAIDSIDNTNLSYVAPPAHPGGAPYNGARTVTVRAPGGAWFELVEKKP